MIKNIVFDLGGVIVPLNRDACNSAFSKIGFKDFDKILNNYVQEGFFLQYEKGEIDSNQFRNIIRDNIAPLLNDNITDIDIDNAMGAFLDPISQEAIDLLISLKQNYKLYMLSNTNPIAISFVKKLFRKTGIEMEECFHHIFLSYQMKLAKPNKEIFKTMIEQANMVPSETLFIDDGPSNIESAVKTGLKTLLYVPGNNLETEVKAAL